ncbi:unnamed protein product [Camellia sinensis]
MSYELNKSKFIAYLRDVKLIYNTMIGAHISHARVAVQKLKIHVTYTTFEVLTRTATFPDKIPSSSSSLFDQQSTDTSSSGNSHRFTSLRQLSNNFAQFNNLRGPLRSRKTVTRKDAAVINEWRFLKLKEHKEGNVEVENVAFDRYMQNVSLLEEVLTVDSTPEGSTNNGPPRSENVTKRVQDIVNQGLRKLQKIELGNGDNDSSKQVELVECKKRENLGGLRGFRSPSIKAAVSPVGAQENKNSTQTQMEMRSSIGSDTKFRKVLESATSDRTEFASSNEGSSVSEKIPNGETVAEAEDDRNTKQFKPNEGSGSENDSVKTGMRMRNKQRLTRSLLSPQRTTFIVQREKISERRSVNGKALMLDEIINYVQSLQQEVEFLSMKLASVNPRLEFNMDSLLSKDVFQPNGSFPHQTYPLDSSASAFFGQQTQEFPPVHTDLSNGDHTSTTLCQNNGMQLPPVDEFGQGLPQFPTLCDDDLQSIVQMGFGQEPKPQYRISIISHEN